MSEPRPPRAFRLTPPQYLMAGFAAMILVGALLLSLPIASASGRSIGFLDALFTATSAHCVTGLVVVTTATHWTWFGKIVILLLIQAGALGFMTVMTIGLLLARRRITLRERMIIQASFNQGDIGGMVRLVRNVLLLTAFFEAVGAVALALAFWLGGDMPLGEAAVQGVFHSVSAFCNAGFDNLGATSMVAYRGDVPVNLVLMALIVAGGIGFPTWAEVRRAWIHRGRPSLRVRLLHMSLHAKIAFAVTFALIALGAALFLLLEWGNPDTLGPLPAWQKALAALFQSVTLRTAGFNSIAQDGLTEASQFVSCIWMVIGGSPSSTAGGMKTVTVGVVLIAMLSALRGRHEIEAYGRSLSLDLLQKALTVVSAMLIVVIASTLILCVTERATAFPHGFMDLLFESCSAAGTVGVTTGITPHLSPAGKIVITICMYLGRLSPVTVVVAMNARQAANDIAYPKENVIIG